MPDNEAGKLDAPGLLPRDAFLAEEAVRLLPLFIEYYEADRGLPAPWEGDDEIARAAWKRYWAARNAVGEWLSSTPPATPWAPPDAPVEAMARRIGDAAADAFKEEAGCGLEMAGFLERVKARVASAAALELECYILGNKEL